MKKICFFFLLLPFFSLAQPDNDVEQVKAFLQQQQAAWNRADIEAFMATYWQSEDLQFGGSDGFIFGWENTLERYKRKYPDAEAMGQLTFDIIKIRKIQRNMILIGGKFTLIRKNDIPTGFFTLIWKKIKGEWKIIADHTS